MIAVVFKKQRRFVCLFCICVSLSGLPHEHKAVDVHGADPNREVTVPQVVRPEVIHMILAVDDRCTKSIFCEWGNATAGFRTCG